MDNAFLVLHSYRGSILINIGRVDSSWNIITYNTIYGITITVSNATINLKVINATPFYFELEQISGKEVSASITQVS